MIVKKKYREKNMATKENFFTQNARRKKTRKKTVTGIVAMLPNGNGPTRAPWCASHSGQHVQLGASKKNCFALDRDGVSNASFTARSVSTAETFWIGTERHGYNSVKYFVCQKSCVRARVTRLFRLMRNHFIFLWTEEGEKVVPHKTEKNIAENV